MSMLALVIYLFIYLFIFTRNVFYFLITFSNFVILYFVRYMSVFLRQGPCQSFNQLIIKKTEQITEQEKILYSNIL